MHSAFLSLVTLTFDLDIQTRLSEGPITVNLAQIRSAVPDIYDSQTNKKVTDK